MGCSAHLLRRVITNSIKEDDIVGHCHAVYIVTRQPHHREKLIQAACEIVDEDFECWVLASTSGGCSAHQADPGAHFAADK